MADDDDPPCDLRTLTLSQREVDLLLQYACPWPDDEERLRNSKPKRGQHHVQIECEWISMMICDLVHSAKTLHNRALLDELDALCSVLENTEQHDERIH